MQRIKFSAHGLQITGTFYKKRTSFLVEGDGLLEDMDLAHCMKVMRKKAKASGLTVSLQRKVMMYAISYQQPQNYKDYT